MPLNMTEDELNELAEKLGPIISQKMLHKPTFWGDESRVHAGEDVHYINGFFNTACGHIYIGDHTFFGQNVSVLTGSHPINKKNKERHWHPSDGNDIIIGEGVWISSHSVILGPCKIGDHAVIGAGSVVLPGEYEGGCLYAGNPAKLKKRINFN